MPDPSVSVTGNLMKSRNWALDQPYLDVPFLMDLILMSKKIPVTISEWPVSEFLNG